MSWGLIAGMGHITIRTSTFEESIVDAKQILGLRETARSEGVAYLAAAEVHHELTYIESDLDGVDRLGLIAANGDALQTIRKRVSDEGFEVLAAKPTDDGVEDAFSFVGPEGFVFEILVGMQPSKHASPQFGPKRYGHFNFHPRDAVGMKDFLERVLDFRVSDRIGIDYAYFLRCNSEHHGIAVIRGGGTLHHHAWQAQSVTELTQMADRLHDLGRDLLWGPVRHGAGNNIAAYYLERSGNVVELYTDIEQIYDDERDPVVWAEGENWYNKWNNQIPRGFRQHGLAPSSRI